MFIMMLVYIFLGGVLRRTFIALGLRCCAHSLFFYGAYFFIFYFLLLLLLLFFENHGLGLGTALFRLGIQVGPAMQKNFNLSWKFFQIFRENLGFETCFKFQFGDSLAWMTIQVSNRG
jgi:hypothetical protein